MQMNVMQIKVKCHLVVANINSSHAEINPRQFMHMNAMQIEVKSHLVAGTVPASASNLSVSPFTSSLQIQPPQ